MPVDQIVEFVAHGISDDPAVLGVVRMDGVEAVSSPYRFEMELLSKEKNHDLAKAVGSTGRLSVKARVKLKDGSSGTRKDPISGVVASFEQLGLMTERVIYKAVLVPRLWNLTLTVQSRVFQDLSVPDMVGEVLDKGYGLKKGQDFDFKVEAAKYPKREYVVQYRETDLDFVSRWLEHEGIYFFFEQTDKGEKVIFSDKKESYGKMPGEPEIPYRPGSGGRAAGSEGGGEEAVKSFVGRQRRVPKEVHLQDWNYRTPAVDLRVKATVDDKGVGHVYEYGNHYKTKSEGETLAKVRAEAIVARRKVFEGAGDCRLFRAGQVLALKGHYRSDFNGKYFLTSVRHTVVQPADATTGKDVVTRYDNEFTGIPADVLFRPERVTPWPRVSGTLNATVDSAGDGKTAEIDDEGRYRVKLPLDLSDKKDGKASRPMRMAQPYAGPDHGSHFPLRKGVEVLLGHAEGDPDRPVILSAVPNPSNGSPVKAANQTQSVVKSARESMLRFEDKEGEEHVFLYSKKDKHFRTENESREWVGGEQHVTVKKKVFVEIGEDVHEKLKATQYLDVGGESHVVIGSHHALQVGANFTLVVKADFAQKITGNFASQVTGGIHLKAEAPIVIESTAGITIKCGGSLVVVDSGGVTLSGPKVTIDGKMTMINSGPGSPAGSAATAQEVAPKPPEKPKEPLGPTAVAAGSGASGSTEAAAPAESNTAPATERSFASESGAPAAAQEQNTPAWIELVLNDPDGKAIPGERYVLKLPDGSTQSGYLDDTGKKRIEGLKKGQCKVSFPDIDGGEWRDA